jgi:hypothetical protein
VDVYLHDHLVLPPVVPLAGVEGVDVHRWTLGSVLEVVAAEGAGRVHRRPHIHVHLVEVHEDCHQCGRVRRHVLELKAIVLQKCEKEGGEWECEPEQGVQSKVDEFIRLHASKRSDPTPHLPIEPQRLPPNHPPQLPKIDLCAEMGGQEVGCHHGGWWPESGKRRKVKGRREKMGKFERKKARVRVRESASQISPSLPTPATIGKNVVRGAWCL